MYDRAVSLIGCDITRRILYIIGIGINNEHCYGFYFLRSYYTNAFEFEL